MMKFVESTACVVMSVDCHVNEKFFDDWNDKSAYVFGYILTDGYINVDYSGNRLKNIKLELTSKDYDLLSNVCKAMECAYKISLTREFVALNGNKTRHYHVQMFSKHMGEKLISLGAIQNKSKVVSFPVFIPDINMSDCIRGIFDGDGSVVVTDYKYCVCVTFCSGSELFLVGIRDYLHRVLDIYSEVRKRGKNVYTLVYYNNKVRAIYDFMYSGNLDVKLFLKRKYDRFKNYFKSSPDNPDTTSSLSRLVRQ